MRTLVSLGLVFASMSPACTPEVPPAKDPVCLDLYSSSAGFDDCDADFCTERAQSRTLDETSGGFECIDTCKRAELPAEISFEYSDGVTPVTLTFSHELVTAPSYDLALFKRTFVSAWTTFSTQDRDRSALSNSSATPPQVEFISYQNRRLHVRIKVSATQASETILPLGCPSGGPPGIGPCVCTYRGQEPVEFTLDLTLPIRALE